MKPLVLVLGTAWALTLGAAFLVGQKSARSAAEAEAGPADHSPLRTRSLAAKSSRGDRPERSDSARTAARRATEAGRIVAGATPRQAVVELAQLTDPIERAKGFLALIDTLSADDFRGVIADFRALGMTEQRMSEYGMLLHAWGQVDPHGALEYAMADTGTPFARQTILTSWAGSDPDAAIAYARENHQGDGPNQLLVGVIRGVAPSDLNRATGLLQELPYSQERGEALSSMLPFVMENGVEVALNWTNGLADERLKSGAVTYIMSDLSMSQPEVAAEVLPGLADGNAAIRVADVVASSLASVSLERAVVWTESLQPDLRAEAAGGIAGLYASRDPLAAAQWLDSISGTTNLDSAIRSFAWTTQARDPQLAAEWIGRVQNERQRDDLYRGVLSRWWSADAAAAEQWIQSSPDLPEAIRQLPGALQARRDRPRQ